MAKNKKHDHKQYSPAVTVGHCNENRNYHAVTVGGLRTTVATNRRTASC